MESTAGTQSVGMETPPRAVLEAVIKRAKAERWEYEFRTSEAARYAEVAQENRDEASAARERYEQCVAFLDRVNPDWDEEDLGH